MTQVATVGRPVDWRDAALHQLSPSAQPRCGVHGHGRGHGDHLPAALALSECSKPSSRSWIDVLERVRTHSRGRGGGDHVEHRAEWLRKPVARLGRRARGRGRRGGGPVGGRRDARILRSHGHAAGPRPLLCRRAIEKTRCAWRSWTNAWRRGSGRARIRSARASTGASPDPSPSWASCANVRLEGLTGSIESIGTAYFPHTQAPPLRRLRWIAIKSACRPGGRRARVAFGAPGDRSRSADRRHPDDERAHGARAGVAASRDEPGHDVCRRSRCCSRCSGIYGGAGPASWPVARARSASAWPWGAACVASCSWCSPRAWC